MRELRRYGECPPELAHVVCPWCRGWIPAAFDAETGQLVYPEHTWEHSKATCSASGYTPGEFAEAVRTNAVVDRAFQPRPTRFR